MRRPRRHPQRVKWLAGRKNENPVGGRRVIAVGGDVWGWGGSTLTARKDRGAKGKKAEPGQWCMVW